MTIAIVALTAGTTDAALEGPRSSVDPIRQLQQRVAAYMTLHRQVEAQVPPLRVTADAREIENAVAAMAKGMREARADANIGDVMTPEIGEVFRSRIASALSQSGIAPSEIVAESLEERPRVETSQTVNERFQFFARTPALILEVLPRLPSELQYRFVGADLALVDLHSGLIVDILPRALPTK